MNKKRAVILLGAETPQCLYCINSLMHSDFSIICVGKGSVLYSSFNGRVKENIHLADGARIFQDPRVKKHYSEFDEIFVYALNDDYLDYLIGEIESLPRHVVAVTPDPDAVRFVSDKAEFLGLCRSSRIPVLSYTLVSSTLSLENLKRGGIHFPVILKPNRGSGARGFLVLEDAAQFEKLDFSKFENYHIQHYVPNANQYKFTASCSDGQIINEVILHKLRYFPASGGSCTFGTVVSLPEISRICSLLVAKLKWDGVIDFDILSPSENEYYPIEVNPRLPASVRYSHCVGVDFVTDIFSKYPGFSQSEIAYRKCDHVFFVTLDMARSVFLMFRLDFTGIVQFFKALVSRSVKVDYYSAMPLSLVTSIVVQISKAFSIGFIKSKFFKNR